MHSIDLSNKAVVFLDRDGVLNVDKYLTYRPEQFALVDGVITGLSCLQALGFSFIVITNQSAVGRGQITEEDVVNFNQILVQTLYSHRIVIQDIFMCPHDPEFGIGVYRQDCACRKPKPGMFFQAADKYGLRLTDCYYIGDKKSDVVAGFNAGCRTILVETGILDDEHKFPGVSPHFRVKNLLGAAQVIAGEFALQRMKATSNFVAPFNADICTELNY